MNLFELVDASIILLNSLKRGLTQIKQSKYNLDWREYYTNSIRQNSFISEVLSFCYFISAVNVVWWKQGYLQSLKYPHEYNKSAPLGVPQTTFLPF